MSKFPFHYVNGNLFCENLSLASLASERCPTPCYVYSRLALKCGFPGQKIFFNGNGKQIWEIELAVENDCFLNVDSKFDAENICRVAEQKDKVVQVLLRLNPAISANVHPFLNTGKSSKFGIPESDLPDVLQTLRGSRRVMIIGVHIHVGSTISDVSVFTAVQEYGKKIISRNHEDFKHAKIINIGGGLAVDYRQEGQGETPSPSDLAEAVRGETEYQQYQVMVEPGRSLVATAGLLLCRVLGTKTNGDNNFAIIDGSMTELLRPALYSAHHRVLPCRLTEAPARQYSVVGPVCESADCLAPAVTLPTLHTGDLIAIMDTGAYGSCMASNYNMRARPAEILVHRDNVITMAERENLEQMLLRFKL